MINLEGLEEKIEYKFKNKELLMLAITHKSYAHEKKKVDPSKNNERLEFLGDAILEHVVSIYLYNKIPIMREGIMSKKRSEVVCESSLSNIIKKLDIQEYLLLGKCEINTKTDNKDALIADMFEAILGAVYLDSDYETANKYCINILKEEIEATLASNDRDFDYKTRLQEILQKQGRANIEYILLNEKGREHDKTFYSEIFFNNKKIGEGSGKNKKESEQMAAREGLKTIENKN
jgi:ribonuclease-3